MSEAQETTQELVTEVPVGFTRRAIHLARTALTPVVGTGIAVGSAYLGYRFSSEAVSQSSMGDIADRVAVVGGTIAGGGFGALAGVEIMPAVAGTKPQPKTPEKPQEEPTDQPTSAS